MDIDIYKTYKFDFDQDLYIDELKKALNEHGVKKPSQLNKILKGAGITDYGYEMVKSFFYGRRVPTPKVFFAICKSLDLCADSIAFPQSIRTPAHGGEIRTAEDWYLCDNAFLHVFYPYDYEDYAPDLADFFNAETYESDVDKIALILSRYNYLIQKYHYAAASEDELDEIFAFTKWGIIDRDKDKSADPHETMDWIRNCKDEYFLKAFYDKYTIGCYSKSGHSSLKNFSTLIDSKFIRYAAQLLPEQDKF